MSTLLRVWWARSWAPKLLLVLVPALEALNFLDRGAPWRGEFVWALDWWGTVLVLLGPIVAGAIAVDAGRSQRQGADDLSATFKRRSAARLLDPVLTVALVIVLDLIAFACAAVAARPWVALPAVALVGLFHAGFLLLVAGVGVVLGRLCNRFVGPALSVVVVLAGITVFGRSSGRFAPLEVGGSTSTLIGFEPNPSVFLTQALVLAVAAALLLASQLGGRRSARGFLIPLAVAVVVGSTVLGQVNRFVPAPQSPNSFCLDADVYVCVTEAHRRLLEPTTELVLSMYARAAAGGVASSLPDRVTERSPAEGPSADRDGRLFFSSDNLATDDVDVALVAAAVATPWHCPALYGEAPPPPSYWTDLDGVTRYLSDDTSDPELVYDATEVRSALARFAECDL